MTLMLASVVSREEAEIALVQGADIIDCKEPARGALGALPLDTVADIVAIARGRRPVSAVVDLPHDISHARRAFEDAIETGVDYVKFALPATPDAAESVEHALTLLAARHFDQPPRILIAGSLFLAAHVLAANGSRID